MGRWFLVALSTVLPLAADPVALKVDLIKGSLLSFRLQSHYASPVTRFEVAADFGEHHELGCGLTVEVKRPKDLHPRPPAAYRRIRRPGKSPPWHGRLGSSTSNSQTVCAGLRSNKRNYS